MPFAPPWRGDQAEGAGATRQDTTIDSFPVAPDRLSAGPSFQRFTISPHPVGNGRALVHSGSRYRLKPGRSGVLPAIRSG